jgi:hypothetical protein
MYQTVSAFIGSQTLEHLRRCILAAAQLQRIRKVVELIAASSMSPEGTETLQWRRLRDRSQQGDRTTTVRHLDRLARLDPTQVFTRPLRSSRMPLLALVLQVANRLSARPQTRRGPKRCHSP